ncbi:MAG: RNA methyltransferase [Chitinophagaceae bacterium]|nr:RNA methyltransferase [Chitinophagaceae bacterium]MCF8421753.1 RNA methyltransferase [Chitinophagaceae bacterium]
MEELGRKSVEDFKLADKKPLVVVMDNIRSMHNVGSVFRTADAFLISGICLCGFTPQPPHRDIHKTALGATDSVDWLYYENTVDAVLALKARGYKVLAIEQTEGSIMLDEYVDKQMPTAFVFGNEVDGVSDEVIQVCDGVIEIPQWGMKHSLNISVAAAVVLWEFVRKVD